MRKCIVIFSAFINALVAGAQLNVEAFKWDYKTLALKEDKKYITIYKPEITSTRSAPVKNYFGITLSNPISFLYNKFHHLAREMKRRSDLKNNKLKNYTDELKFFPQFISLATGLPWNRTMELAAYCSFLRPCTHYSNYDLIVVLQRCLNNYKYERNLTDEDLGIKHHGVRYTITIDTDSQNK